MTDTARPPCRDFEVCGNVSDPRYTMDFTGVEPGAFIHWCASCGPLWTAVSERLDERFEAEGDAFTEELEAAVSAARDRRNQ